MEAPQNESPIETLNKAYKTESKAFTTVKSDAIQKAVNAISDIIGEDLKTLNSKGTDKAKKFRRARMLLSKAKTANNNWKSKTIKIFHPIQAFRALKINYNLNKLEKKLHSSIEGSETQKKQFILLENRAEAAQYLSDAFDKLSEESLQTEGIFRITPQAPLKTSPDHFDHYAKKLSERSLDSDIPEIPTLTTDDQALYIAQALKKVIKDKEGNGPIDNLEEFKKCFNNENKVNIDEMKKLIEKMPEQNQTALKYTIKALVKTNNYSESNKMVVSNLSIAISPSLFTQTTNLEDIASMKQVCSAMIENYTALFE